MASNLATSAFVRVIAVDLLLLERVIDLNVCSASVLLEHAQCHVNNPQDGPVNFSVEHACFPTLTRIRRELEQPSTGSHENPINRDR